MMASIYIEEVLKNIYISWEIAFIVASNIFGMLCMMFGDIIHCIEIWCIIGDVSIVKMFARMWIDEFKEIIGASAQIAQNKRLT